MGIVSTDDEKLSGIVLASGQATAQGGDVHEELTAAVESIAMTGRAAQRVDRTILDPLGPVTEHIFELADAIYNRTGRHGITRISLTPEVGLAFGIVPGTSMDVQTPVGRVEVYAERGPRLGVTFTVPPPVPVVVPNGPLLTYDEAAEIAKRTGVWPQNVAPGTAGVKPPGPGDEDRSER
jgi:hypothetical protein